jgi:hypothetical protein
MGLEAALFTEKLVSEGLFSEASEVCCGDLSFLSAKSQEMLRENLISRLPGEELPRIG